MKELMVAPVRQTPLCEISAWGMPCGVAARWECMECRANCCTGHSHDAPFRPGRRLCEACYMLFCRQQEEGRRGTALTEALKPHGIAETSHEGFNVRVELHGYQRHALMITMQGFHLSTPMTDLTFREVQQELRREWPGIDLSALEWFAKQK